MNSWSSGQPKNDERHFLSTLHPLSKVFIATATVVAFVLYCFAILGSTSIVIHSTYSEIGLRLLAWKITKGINLCKPASLNRPIAECGKGEGDDHRLQEEQDSYNTWGGGGGGILYIYIRVWLGSMKDRVRGEWGSVHKSIQVPACWEWENIDGSFSWKLDQRGCLFPMK